MFIAQSYKVYISSGMLCMLSNQYAVSELPEEDQILVNIFGERLRAGN